MKDADYLGWDTQLEDGQKIRRKEGYFEAAHHHCYLLHLYRTFTLHFINTGSDKFHFTDAHSVTQ